MSIIIGTGKNDLLAGTTDGDTIFGSGGNDNISGGSSGDVLFGGGNGYRHADLDSLSFHESTTAVITFGDSSAGYKNAVGMYKIAADGTISGVEILTSPNTNNGQGGHNKPLLVDVAAGESLGFFVVPNGYGLKGKGTNFLTTNSGHYELRDAAGNPASANSTGPLSLWHIGNNGAANQVKSQYGADIFHSFKGESTNSDGLIHAKGVIDLASGVMKLGFEDLKGGGDADFDDAVINIAMGQTNAALMKGLASDVTSLKPNNDVINGGEGDDRIFTMSGDDQAWGGDGNDRLWGAAGNDSLSGDAGDDELNGGSGNDLLAGGDGNDALIAGSGNDALSDGAGNDQVIAAANNDMIVAGEGNDRYNGGSGIDGIDFSGATAGVSVNMSKHWAVGMGNDWLGSIENLIGSAFGDKITGDKRDNSIDGGAGNDVIRGLGGADKLIGGEGADIFVFTKKDVAAGGVDVVKDLDAAEGDKLDLHDILKYTKKSVWADVVEVTDGANGTVVSIDPNKAGNHEKAIYLVGVHADSLSELIADKLVIL